MDYSLPFRSLFGFKQLIVVLYGHNVRIIVDSNFTRRYDYNYGDAASISFLFEQNELRKVMTFWFLRMT